MFWERTYTLPITAISKVIEEIVRRNPLYRIGRTGDIAWHHAFEFGGTIRDIVVHSGFYANHVGSTTIVGRDFHIEETASVLFTDSFTLYLADLALIRDLFGVKNKSGSIALELLGQRNAETYIRASGGEFPKFSATLRGELDTLLMATGR